MSEIFVVVHEGYKKKWLFGEKKWFTVSGVFENKEQALKQGQRAAKVFEGIVLPIDEKPYYLHIKTTVMKCWLVEGDKK